MVSIWLEKIIRKDRKWEKVGQKGIRWVLKLCQFSHLSIRMECKLLIGCRVIEFFILHDGASFIGTTLVVEILVYLSSFLSSKGDWIPQLALLDVHCYPSLKLLFLIFCILKNLYPLHSKKSIS